MKLFWSFTRQAFHNTVVYRVEFWIRLVSILLAMYSIRAVWQTLYTQRPDAFGLTLGQMVTYGVLGMALHAFIDTGSEWYIATQVRTGAIDTDLLKPIDFHVHMLARNLGEMLFGMGVMALPTYAIGYFVFGLQLPPDAGAAGLFALSVLLGFLVQFHLGFLLGSVAFATLDIRSIAWAYFAVISFFSGQMVPLWMFPDGLRAVAEILPLQAVYYIPMSIYIGTYSGTAAWSALGFQALWALILAGVARLAWHQVHRRLTVQGG
ncbi:MAG TPA: ABC-2 family transporter protein [Anaerolineales bacterium]|nr:ABC-2 family transporter protein [Anaerolineales bacterium]HRF46075.1 ABC-2 family transporter protein [Anaerolineales bacterium]